MHLIRAFLKALGIDYSVGISLVARLFSVVSGPVSLVVVSTFLTVKEQAYFYTFTSLFGIKMLFDLGMGRAITQHVAHCYGSRQVNRREANNFRQIVRFSGVWYLVAAGLLFVVLIVAGNFIMGKNGGADIKWYEAWVVAAAGVSLLSFLSPIYSIQLGLQMRSEVFSAQCLSEFLMKISLWLCLCLGLGLFSVSISLAVSLTIVLLYALYAIFGNIKRFYLEAASIIERRFYRGILKFQSKLVLSWVGIYLSLFSLVPVVFKLSSIEFSARFGMSVTLSMAISNIGLIWVSTKAPLFGRLVAEEKFIELWISFKGAAIRGFMVATFFYLIALAVIAVGVSREISQLDRLLPISQMLFLFLKSALILTASYMTDLLRAFKDEPLFLIFLANGIIDVLVTIFVLIYFDPIWLTLALASTQALVFTPLFLFRGLGHFRRFTSVLST